ncbi:DUF3786 domain-containing protein [Chloroflexota bacterium]
MSLEGKELLSIKQIEGPIATHDGFLKREMDRRQVALAYVNDVSKLAKYIGGKVESLGRGEDWVITKEMFPGIEIVFMYTRADDEFPSSLRVLYTGERIKKTKGEDLAELTIACVNQMLRYIKETLVDPPEICTRI